MEYKALQIETADKWEAQGIKTLHSSQEFSKELQFYHRVDDIFSDPRVKIRQDEGKYIFNINGSNKFSINTGYLQSRLKDFYDEKKDKEQRKTEEEVHIRIEWLEITYNKSKTKEDLEKLQHEILATWNIVEQATNIENVKFKVGRLITFFEKELTFIDKKIWYFGGITNKKNEVPLWRIHKSQIEERIKQLKNIKQKVERLEQNKDKTYTIKRKSDGEVDVIYDDIEGFDTQTTLLRLSEKIDELGKEAPQFMDTRNDILLDKGDTTPYYEIIINKETATTLRNQLKNLNKEHLKTIEITLGADKRQALQQDLDRMLTYLQNYMNNPNIPLPPFEFESREAFELLCTLDPNMKSLKQLNKKSNKPTDGKPNPKYAGYEAPEGSTWTNIENQTNQTWGWRQTYAPTNYESAKEAFAKWWVGWAMKHRIDQTNMSDQQKQFRSWAWNLAMTAGMVFVGWKMVSSAWNLLRGKHKWDKEAKRKARTWLLAPTALIFWAQARSGEWPGKVFTWGALSQKIAWMFWRNYANEDTNSQIWLYQNTANTSGESRERQIKYTEWFQWTTALFNGMTYGEMNQFLIQDKNTIKINPEKYEELLELLENWPNKNEAALSFVKSIGKHDDKRIINLWLTGMGIKNVRQLEREPDKKFDETAANAIVRLNLVTEYLEKKWYNKVNSETQYLVDEYISTGKPTLEQLDKRGDVFYKFVEIKDETGLGDKIKELADWDKEKEEELLLAINTFYTHMPNAQRNIDIQWDRPNVSFVTYGQKTTINLKDKYIEGFSPSRFSSYFELFKAANLTNRIQDICKDKLATKDEPFYIGRTGNIIFNDADTRSKERDTKIVNAGFLWSLKDISPTLEKHKEAYAVYLNNLRDRKIKPREILDELPAWLISQINTITAGDSTKTAEITLEMKRFYTYMPNASRNIILSWTRPNIEFTTYGEITRINLEHKYIENFSPSRFGSYFELFKAANLTNRIQAICKDKLATKDEPFYIGQTGNIIFDNADTRSKERDTKIVNAGFLWSLKDISPTLEKHKEAYTVYLNGLRNWTVRPPEVEPLDPLPPALETSINTIMLARPQIEKDAVLLWMKRFYTKMPSSERNRITLTGTRPTLYFGTYGQRTDINLQYTTMDTFSAPKFTDEEELFKAANLTNYIKMITNGKDTSARDGKPFYEGKTGNIIFNDEGTRSLSTDTKILSAGLFGTLGKISPTLEKYKTEYVAYLNTLRDRTWLLSKVRTFSAGNAQREKDIIAALNVFYDYMPNNTRKIELIPAGGRPNIWFKTYGKITYLDMQSKGVLGFTPGPFPDYIELFKAASLTNRIRQICNTMTGTTKDPFNISIPWGDIEFAKKGIFKRDIEIISGWRWGSLWSISPKLEANKKAYVDYLNNLYNTGIL